MRPWKPCPPAIELQKAFGISPCFFGALGHGGLSISIFLSFWKVKDPILCHFIPFVQWTFMAVLCGLSILVGGLEPWNFTVCFHSVGKTNNPN